MVDLSAYHEEEREQVDRHHRKDEAFQCKSLNEQGHEVHNDHEEANSCAQTLFVKMIIFGQGDHSLKVFLGQCLPGASHHETHRHADKPNEEEADGLITVCLLVLDIL